MKFAMCLLIVCFFNINSVVSKTYQGKIYLTNNEVIKTKAFILKNDVIKYKLKGNPAAISIDNDKVSKVEIFSGSHISEGVAVGLISSVVIIGASGTRLDSFGEFFLYFIGGGAFGGVVGSAFPKHYTINFTESDEFSFLNGVKLMPEINQPNITLINYSLSF